MCVRGGTHTGFVREQTSLGALRNRSLECRTEGAADDRLWRKRIAEDQRKAFRHLACTHDQNDNRSKQKETRHNRHDLFCDRCQTIHAADEDDRTDDDQDDSNNPGRNAECRCTGGADGIGLHHTTAESKRYNDCNCKEAGKESAKTALKGSMNVIDGTALNMTVLMNDSGILCQNRFCINRCHTKKGNEPHPENRTRTTGQNRAGGTDNIAGADLSRDCGSQCLEGTHASIVRASVQGKTPKAAFHAFSEITHLHKACPNREPKTKPE